MNKPYFDVPKQVVFHDIDNPQNWLVGIAYKDEIICSCCGGVYEIAEVCELSEGYVEQAIYPYEEWVDLSTEISGGEWPDGLTDIQENGEYRVVEVCAIPTEDYEQMTMDDGKDYEAYAFNLEEEEEVQAVFANTWVDGVAMPEI